MTPTTQYLVQQFGRFNKQYFDGCLPQPRIVVCKAKTYLGLFSCKRPRTWLPLGQADKGYTIKISAYYDLPELVCQSTLLHEMIHYHIMYKRLKDTSPHGTLFRAFMRRFNNDGWRVCVRTSTKGYAIADSQDNTKPRTVLALRTDDSKCYLSVVNDKAVGRMESVIRRLHGVVFHKWCVSSDSYFADFPAVRTLRGRRVSEELFFSVVNGG